MTIDISANNPRISYSVAAGVTQTSFAVPFEFFDDSDLNVYIDTTLQTITTNYTVTGGAGSTGTVTMSVTGPKTVILTRDTTIERTTDFTAGVDINRAALNTQLDTLTAIAADNKDLGERSIRITDYDPAASSLLLPDAATRADKLLSFDTEGDVSVQSAADLLTGNVLGANYTKASHTGDGTIVAFSTTEAAGSKNNIQVYIDGVYQNKDTFSISGSVLTFSEAPPLNSAIEFIVGNAVTSLTTDPDVVTYNQGGTGAQDRTLTSKLQETVSVKDFGAVGDGVTDDTAAFNSAIAASNYIYIPEGTYLVNIILDAKRGYTFKGAGRDVTNLKNFTDNPVFTLDASSGDCKFNVFEGFRIINRDKAVYTNAIGFYQLGSGSLECDFNEFRSLEIVSMKHGFQFTTRSIWNSFEDVHVYDSISDGFKAVVTDNCSGFSFRQCRFGQNGGHGMYVSKDSGDLLANWTFNNVTFEKNDLTGLYVGGTSCGIQGWMLMGCYFEENTKTVAASSTAPRKANIFIDAQSCYGLVVDACSLYGTPLATALDWGIYISSTNASGRIGPNRTGVYTLGAISTTGSFMVEQQAGGTTGLVLGAGSKDFTKLVEEVTGDFTITLTGVTTTVTGTARFVRNTNQVTIYIPLLEGTSNTTAATLTGMPASIQPTRTQNVVCITKDNGASAAALAQIPSTGIIALYKDVGGGSFTASGTKGIQAITLTYALD